ncbi:MAG: DM13 domain-containing protein [Cyanobacteria bacterium P01_F01_bin.4]
MYKLLRAVSVTRSPAEVSVEDFQSAVIWCRQFDVTFGYAAL